MAVIVPLSSSNLACVFEALWLNMLTSNVIYMTSVKFNQAGALGKLGCLAAPLDSACLHYLHRPAVQQSSARLIVAQQQSCRQC